MKANLRFQKERIDLYFENKLNFSLINHINLRNYLVNMLISIL